MKETLKDAIWGMPWGLYLILLIAAALLIAAFIMPPIAYIHKSVLLAAAELIGGGWLYYTFVHIPDFIQRGATIRAEKGDAKIEITGNDTKD